MKRVILAILLLAGCDRAAQITATSEAAMFQRCVIDGLEAVPPTAFAAATGPIFNACREQFGPKPVAKPAAPVAAPAPEPGK